ncbi:FecCD family ABC transporter permease [Pseudoalteromonas ulvae]|uniref:Iron ABC transporter n=1 Tax=Pseudoalteromonas ulvae TaxID=107327 RepID=A0A244CLX7_PSEDV|nr:iron ABC transporter permease [Pseudoalteromonas ulvae]OUL55973.1 iron ABC transporter [Pseudoalteromonas ulvae]
MWVEQSLLSRHTRPRQLFIPALCVLTVFVALIGLQSGAIDLSWSQLFSVFINNDHTSLADAVIWQIRLPRLVLCVLVGAGLGACGAAMQAIFRNPLADPGLIGVSGGAALGAVSMIVLGSSLFAHFSEVLAIYAVPVGAFIGALIVCSFIYRLSSHGGEFTIVSLLLAGIAVNAIVGSLIGFLTLISTDQQLRDLTFWSMGSLAGNSWKMIFPVAVIIVLSCCVLLKSSQALNLYLLGEHQARHLGLDVVKLKKQVFLCTALCLGAAVSITGVIGFVGFIVPHLVRLLIGPDHRYLMPASMLLGAILLSVADLFARTLILPAELPIGLLTSAIGGPFFLIMLFKTFGSQRG